jgi:hypothetical protein
MYPVSQQVIGMNLTVEGFFLTGSVALPRMNPESVPRIDPATPERECVMFA